MGHRSRESLSRSLRLDLRSNAVDLTDLGGFIGGSPARSSAAGAAPKEREAEAGRSASSKLLPDTPISVPRLDWAEIHLRYHGAHIEGRSVPLDDLTLVMDVVGGRITIHPLSFGIGHGQLITNVDLTPSRVRTSGQRPTSGCATSTSPG